MSAEPLLQLSDVAVPSRRDPEVTTVEHVNWTVQRGDFWVVGGMQGSGKSDLTFMLAGLTRPISGSYTLFDQEMARHFGDEHLSNRLRVAMVFDDARIFGGLNVAENVALPVRYHQNLTIEESSGWISALLKETDIAEFADDTPGAISRTWRRRVGLARALALRPELLVLENPLRGLDVRHSTWWVQFIIQLWRGHPLMGGRPMTVIASADEFWPWRNSGAQFAILERRAFTVSGHQPPGDEHRFESANRSEEE